MPLRLPASCLPCISVASSVGYSPNQRKAWTFSLKLGLNQSSTCAKTAEIGLLGTQADTGWFVGKPSFTGLGKGCPSSDNQRVTLVSFVHTSPELTLTGWCVVGEGDMKDSRADQATGEDRNHPLKVLGRATRQAHSSLG